MTTQFHPYIEQYTSLFEEAEKKYKLPSGILKALAQVESGGMRNMQDLSQVRSPVGATGIMQFMPDTAKRFGIDPSDTPRAIDAAGNYLSRLGKMFDGNVPLMLSAYNAGEGTVLDFQRGTNKTGKNPKHASGILVPFKETNNHRLKVMNIMGYSSTDKEIAMREDTATFSRVEDSLEREKRIKELQAKLQSPQGYPQRDVEVTPPIDPNPYSWKNIIDTAEKNANTPSATEPSFSQKFAATARTNFTGAVMSGTEKEVIGEADDDLQWQTRIKDTAGRDEIHKNLQNYVGLSQEDPRYPEAFNILSNSKNQNEYIVTLNQQKRYMQDEETLEQSHGLGAAVGNLITLYNNGAMPREVSFPDILAELAGSAMSPLEFGIGKLFVKGAGMATTAFARAEHLRNIAQRVPKAASSIAAGALEGAASNVATEYLSPVGTTKERLSESGAVGAAFGAATGAVAAAATPTRPLEPHKSVKDAEAEYALVRQGISPEKAEAIIEAKTNQIKKTAAYYQALRDIDIIEDADNLNMEEKSVLQKGYADSLNEADKLFLVKELEDIVQKEGRYAGLLTRIREDSPSTPVEIIIPTDEVRPDLSMGAAQQLGKKLEIDQPLVFRPESPKTPATELAYSFVKGVSEENNMDGTSISSVTPSLQVGLSKLGPFLSTQHWLYGVAKQNPNNAELLNAFSIRFFGESSGKLISPDGKDVRVSSIGTTHRAQTSSEELVVTTRRLALKHLNDYRIATNKTNLQVEKELQQLASGVNIEGSSEHIHLLEKALNVYKKTFADLLDSAHSSGLVTTDVYEKLLASKEEYLPRSFNVPLINKLLGDKGLSIDDLEDLIKDASISFAKQSGQFKTDEQGNFQHPAAERITKGIETKTKKKQANQTLVNEIEKNIEVLNNKISEVSQAIEFRKQAEVEAEKALAERDVVDVEGLKAKLAGLMDSLETMKTQKDQEAKVKKVQEENKESVKNLEILQSNLSNREKEFKELEVALEEKFQKERETYDQEGLPEMVTYYTRGFEIAKDELQNAKDKIDTTIKELYPYTVEDLEGERKREADVNKSDRDRALRKAEEALARSKENYKKYAEIMNYYLNEVNNDSLVTVEHFYKEMQAQGLPVDEPHRAVYLVNRRLEMLEKDIPKEEEALKKLARKRGKRSVEPTPLEHFFEEKPVESPKEIERLQNIIKEYKEKIEYLKKKIDTYSKYDDDERDLYSPELLLKHKRDLIQYTHIVKSASLHKNLKQYSLRRPKSIDQSNLRMFSGFAEQLTDAAKKKVDAELRLDATLARRDSLLLGMEMKNEIVKYALQEKVTEITETKRALKDAERELREKGALESPIEIDEKLDEKIETTVAEVESLKEAIANAEKPEEQVDVVDQTPENVTSIINELIKELKTTPDVRRTPTDVSVLDITAQLQNLTDRILAKKEGRNAQPKPSDGEGIEAEKGLTQDTEQEGVPQESLSDLSKTFREAQTKQLIAVRKALAERLKADNKAAGEIREKIGKSNESIALEQKTLTDYDAKMQKRIGKGAKKFVEKLQQLYFGTNLEDDLRLHREDYEGIAKEMLAEIKKADETPIEGEMSAEEILDKLMEAMYIYTDKNKDSFVSPLMHRAPVDTSTVKTYTNKWGQQVSLGMYEIYGTKNPLVNFENAIRSFNGATVLAKDTGITSKEQVGFLLEEATRGMREDQRKTVRDFMQKTLNYTLAEPMFTKSGLLSAAQTANTLVYINFGAFFPVSQFGEITALPFRSPMATLRTIAKHSERKEMLKSLYKVVLDTKNPRNAIERQHLDMLSAMWFDLPNTLNRTFYDAPISHTQDLSWKTDSIEKIKGGTQRAAETISKSNAHALQKILHSQKVFYKNVGLTEIQHTAKKYLNDRPKYLQRLKDEFPEVYSNFATSLESATIYDHLLLEAIREEHPKDYKRVSKLVEKTMLDNATSDLLIREMGIPPSKVKSVLEAAESLGKESTISSEGAEDLYNALNHFADSLSFSSTMANTPKFLYDYPALNLMFQLAKWSFEAWNTLAHPVLTSPATARVWGALAGSIFAGYINQELLFIVTGAIPTMASTLASGGSIEEGMQNVEEKRKEKTAPKKEEDRFFNTQYSNQYALGILARSGALSLPLVYYRDLAGVVPLPDIEYLRASSLPGKGMVESTPIISATSGFFEAGISVKNLLTQEEINQKDVKTMLTRLPLSNANIFMKTILLSVLNSPWYERLPEKPLKQ